LQDLNQLVKLYPKDWETFLGNAGAQLFMAPRDNFTARWISEKCGQTEIAVPRPHHSPVEMWEQEGRVENPMGLGVNVDQIPRPLMLPHEVAYMGGDELLVFGENLGGIIRAGRKSYMKTPQYAGKFGPNPYHAGAKKSWWSW
jgi:type IV secretion system protein VirD4